jgi:hypothetical protein
MENLDHHFKIACGIGLITENNFGSNELRFSSNPHRSLVPLSSTAFFIFYTTAARTGLVSPHFGFCFGAAGFWPQHRLPAAYFFGNIMQFVAGMPYELLPAGT